MANKLRASTRTIRSLTQDEREILFEIYSKYYAHSNLDIFNEDLDNKDHIFMMYDRENDEIKGFSTIKKMQVEVGGRKVYGIFSGDTIIEKEYWGQSALQVAFIKYFLKFKAAHPFSEVYWYLISKGYKTYLLMANNFTQHYPRFESETPKSMKTVIDSFSRELYPENYCEKSGLIMFENEHDQLKNAVAPITQKMRNESPRIAFFEKMNPSWEKGSELACIARVDLSSPYRYITKYLGKKARKTSNKTIEAMEQLLGALNFRI